MGAWRVFTKLRALSQGTVALPKTLRSRGHKALLAVLVASRREANLNQRQLAERLGVAHSIVGKMESGERRVDVTEFTAYARALKLDPMTLYQRYLAWEETAGASSRPVDAAPPNARTRRSR
jgi:DNA-binding XRE family transcriptional regulator